MIQIAITGGIGCGKSLVGSLLESSGWAVCEADHIAHTLYAPGGPAFEAVVDLGGSEVLRGDGSIDRAALGRIVFADQNRLSKLNALLHPMVREEIEKWVLSLESGKWCGAAAIIPLLFEAGLDEGWDAIVCVGCSPELQQQRLMGRGLGVAEIQLRLRSQWPLERKMSASDFRLWNDGSLVDLQHAVGKIVDLLLERKRE